MKFGERVNNDVLFPVLLDTTSFSSTQLSTDEEPILILTQDYNISHCYSEISRFWSSCSANIDSCMLQLHIRYNKISISYNSGVEDINGFLVWKRNCQIFFAVIKI